MNKYTEKILNDSFLNYKIFYIISAISFVMALISVYYMALYDMRYDYMLLLAAENCIMSSFGLFSLGLSMFYAVGKIKKE